MNVQQKNDIKQLVQESIDIFGGQRAVATKAGVSPATISQIANDNWDLISNEMFHRVGLSLGYQDDAWTVVDNTYNLRVLNTCFADAKRNSMFMAVSHKAGSGKTAGSKLFYSKYKKKHVYYIHCREWSVKQFLNHLCKTLGIEQPRGYVSADALMDQITNFFLVRASHQPLLIIDEADKLKGSAIRCLIPLYNYTEDRLGVVILGTNNLSEEIKRGVRYNKKGYDEIDSRLGRQYISLYGANKKDVKMICAANGIQDKQLQDSIWAECEPKEVNVAGSFVKMVGDLRRLKRIIQRELIRISNQN